jgi:hypothetical protein
MSDQKLGTSKSIRVNHMMFQTDGQAWSSEDGQLHAEAGGSQDFFSWGFLKQIQD